MPKKEIDLTTQTLGAILGNIKSDVDELYEIAEGLTNTIQPLSLARGQRGVFIKIGIMAFYVLGEYRIENIEPGSYVTIDEIPDGFIPATTMNKIAIIGNNVQLTNSLLIRFDRVSGTIKLINLANNRIKNTLLVTSSYEYIVSSSSYDTAVEENIVDPNTVNWDNIPQVSEPATVTPEWEEDPEG